MTCAGHIHYHSCFFNIELIFLFIEDLKDVYNVMKYFYFKLLKFYPKILKVFHRFAKSIFKINKKSSPHLLKSVY